MIFIENGRGFSVGQRQLFCIARAILTRCRILLLDEGASLVDVQTDVLIQETIRKNFVDCTVLKIAHRLNNIVDSDRYNPFTILLQISSVLVLDHGKIIEFDTPGRLMQNKKGLFYSLVSKSGDEAARKLRERIEALHGQIEQPSSVAEISSKRSVSVGSASSNTKETMPLSLEGVFHPFGRSEEQRTSDDAQA